MEMAGQIGAIAEATGAGCRGRGLELGFWDVDGMGLCYGGTRVVTIGSGKWNKDIRIYLLRPLLYSRAISGFLGVTKSLLSV